MRGLGSFLIVVGILSLGMRAVKSKFLFFDWMDHWGAGGGTIIRVLLMLVGLAIIVRSFYTGRHD